MASTSAVASLGSAGHTTLPGLQLSAYGAKINTLKAYAFGLTDARQITGSSTAGSISISGLTTNDIPFALIPSTGVNAVSTAFRATPGSMWVSATNTLEVQWIQNGTSSSSQPGAAAPGAGYTLFTMSYQDQSSSTTT